MRCVVSAALLALTLAPMPLQAADEADRAAALKEGNVSWYTSTPFPLVQQLAEGGRLVLPVGDPDSQVLTVVDNVGGELRQRPHGDCKFVKLVGKYAWDP